MVDFRPWLRVVLQKHKVCFERSCRHTSKRNHEQCTIQDFVSQTCQQYRAQGVFELEAPRTLELKLNGSIWTEMGGCFLSWRCRIYSRRNRGVWSRKPASKSCFRQGCTSDKSWGKRLDLSCRCQRKNHYHPTSGGVGLDPREWADCIQIISSVPYQNAETRFRFGQRSAIQFTSNGFRPHCFCEVLQPGHPIWWPTVSLWLKFRRRH